MFAGSRLLLPVSTNFVTLVTGSPQERGEGGSRERSLGSTPRPARGDGGVTKFVDTGRRRREPANI